MGRQSKQSVLRPIGQLFRSGTSAGLSDEQLLEQFVMRHDELAEAAFASLVERHGPMVLGVCRRLLRDPHDAQDAFQATFLVLVRRAGAIRKRGSLGYWLYGVAKRVTARARAGAVAPPSRGTPRHGNRLGDLRIRPYGPRRDLGRGGPALRESPRGHRAVLPGRAHARAGRTAAGMPRRHGAEPPRRAAIDCAGRSPGAAWRRTVC